MIPTDHQRARMLAAAVDAADRGWPVFLLARSKRPVANCEDCPQGTHDPGACEHLTCHGFYAATTDLARITQMLRVVSGGQLAVRTGNVDTASGLLVVDVDPKNGGTASIRRLVDAGLCPPTLLVVTGSGGFHLYYRHPGGHVPSRALPDFPGIDIKADAGYVVLPPSIHHRTGEPYRWAPDVRPVREMPPPLIRLTRGTAAEPASPERPRQRSTQHAGAGGISHPDRLLTAILDKVYVAPPGSRRVTLYGAARGVAKMIRAHAIAHQDGITALVDAGRQIFAGESARESERDIRRAITDGFRAEGLVMAP